MTEPSDLKPCPHRFLQSYSTKDEWSCESCGKLDNDRMMMRTPTAPKGGVDDIVEAVTSVLETLDVPVTGHMQEMLCIAIRATIKRGNT